MSKYFNSQTDYLVRVTFNKYTDGQIHPYSSIYKKEFLVNSPQEFYAFSYSHKIRKICLEEISKKNEIDENGDIVENKTKQVLETIYVGDFIPYADAVRMFKEKGGVIGCASNNFESAVNTMMRNDDFGIVQSFGKNYDSIGCDSVKIAELDGNGKLRHIKTVKDIQKDEDEIFICKERKGSKKDFI